MRPVLRARRTVLLAAALLAGPLVLALPAPASAAVSCQVDYQILAQWPTGFMAGITLGNDGLDVINGWTLTWTFPADGQMVGHGYNGNFTQLGRVVTVTNATFNPIIPTDRNVMLGFVGSYTGANPVPTDFTVNGQPCTATGGSPNVPPTVAVTTPQFGAALPAGGDIVVSATAGDPDGTVSEVRFYARNVQDSAPVLVGIDTTSPYLGVWFASSAAGTYVLTAVARDNRGAVTTSAPDVVTLG